MANEKQHPAHPVRNFFYTLYSLVNIFAFAAFFYALYAPTLPSRIAVLIGTGVLVMLGIAFGVIRPMCRAKR